MDRPLFKLSKVGDKVICVTVLFESRYVSRDRRVTTASKSNARFNNTVTCGAGLIISNAYLQVKHEVEM